MMKKNGNMFVNIQFNDGSNPYFFRGDEKAIEKELEKWKKRFNLRTVKIAWNTTNNIYGYFIRAEEKINSSALF